MSPVLLPGLSTRSGRGANVEEFRFLLLFLVTLIRLFYPIERFIYFTDYFCQGRVECGGAVSIVQLVVAVEWFIGSLMSSPRP